MSKTVKLSVEVSPTLAMQILELIAGGALSTMVIDNEVQSGPGPEPTVDEAAAKEVADEEEQADEEPEEDPEEAEEASEEESEESEEEPEEEESADDEEPEADDEEGEEEEEANDSDVDEAVEYTLDDIRAELGKFMKTYKTQAAGKKALGAILAGLPTPAKCLSDVEESEYGDLMAEIRSEDDDPLA